MRLGDCGQHKKCELSLVESAGYSQAINNVRYFEGDSNTPHKASIYPSNMSSREFYSQDPRGNHLLQQFQQQSFDSNSPVSPYGHNLQMHSYSADTTTTQLDYTLDTTTAQLQQEYQQSSMVGDWANTCKLQLQAPLAATGECLQRLRNLPTLDKTCLSNPPMLNKTQFQMNVLGTPNAERQRNMGGWISSWEESIKYLEDMPTGRHSKQFGYDRHSALHLQVQPVVFPHANCNRGRPGLSHLENSTHDAEFFSPPAQNERLSLANTSNGQPGTSLVQTSTSNEKLPAEFSREPVQNELLDIFYQYPGSASARCSRAVTPIANGDSKDAPVNNETINKFSDKNHVILDLCLDASLHDQKLESAPVDTPGSGFELDNSRLKSTPDVKPCRPYRKLTRKPLPVIKPGRKKDGFKTEKERRDYINNQYKTLQSLTPYDGKKDRASIVDNAVKYILDLQKQVEEASKKLSLIHEKKFIRQADGREGHSMEEVSVDSKTRMFQWTSKQGAVVNIQIMENEVQMHITQNHRPLFLTRLFSALESSISFDLVGGSGCVVANHDVYCINLKINQDLRGTYGDFLKTLSEDLNGIFDPC